jgi:protein-tyrosine phosphatase
MARATDQHMWGLVLRGPVVARVLPRSPAAVAGFAPHMVLLDVDGEPFNGDEGLDWVTMGKTSVTVVVGDAAHVHREDPRPHHHHHQEHQVLDCSDGRSSGSIEGLPSDAQSHNAPTSTGRWDAPRWELPADRSHVAGPTPRSHWAVPGLILCGPIPDPRHPRLLEQLARECFDVVVSLVDIVPARQYLTQLEALAGKKVRRVMSVPLPDGQPLTESTGSTVLSLAREICSEVREGAKVYIHCLEGHGRTGMVVSVVLAMLYGLSGMKAVNLCDALHSCRLDTGDRSSPETQEQRLSVVALLGSQ